MAGGVASGASTSHVMPCPCTDWDARLRKRLTCLRGSYMICCLESHSSLQRIYRGCVGRRVFVQDFVVRLCMPVSVLRAAYSTCSVQIFGYLRLDVCP